MNNLFDMYVSVNVGVYHGIARAIFSYDTYIYIFPMIYRSFHCIFIVCRRVS